MSRVNRAPDYDFGPYEDEYRGFDMRDDETGRGPLILILALGVLLIFAGVVWNTYRQGVRAPGDGLPIISADSAPYKRAPDERGGIEVAGQENGFYESMDGMGDPALLQKTAVLNPVDLRRSDPVLSGGPTADLPPVTQVPAEASNTGEQAEEPVPSGPIRLANVQSAGEIARTEALPEVSTSVELQPEPVRSPFTPGGSYQVQLMAVRSEEAARSAWSNIRSEAPVLYKGAALDIQKADLGARGTFYRLRVGAFSNREAAKEFCAEVKATGNDCMVVSKASG